MSDALSATCFDAGSLVRRYAFLDECPEHLLGDVISLPVGSLEQRVAGVRAWRDALLSGRLPAETTWPAPEVASAIRAALVEMDVARFCKGQPELTDALILDLLAAIRAQTEITRSEVAARLQDLARLERERRESEEEARARREERPPRSVRVDADRLRELRARAESEVATKVRPSDPRLIAAWAERARAWAAIADVFGDLGALLGRGWDLAQGVLRHTGWLDLVRLRALVESLPQLQAIVRSLGRIQISEDQESVSESVMEGVRRLEQERRDVWTPGVPEETRGIERSGEIARMLPVEALMLGHPTLRFLWHARRAERALLTYRVEGVVLETVVTETEGQVAVEKRAPRRERGPIVAVIDTSGSMEGVPEQVAKALVLEAARVAHVERRRCYLYAYSGPGQVVEHELDLSPEGIGRLLEFLSRGFGGGTDVSVLTKVSDRLREKAWAKADVVVVSDGEWPAPASVLDAVRAGKERGVRFHGVLIGSVGRTGMHAVCDPVHVFQDWAEVGGWRR